MNWNVGLVTETRTELRNGDFRSRPPRADVVCYSHYQNSYSTGPPPSSVMS